MTLWNCNYFKPHRTEKNILLLGDAGCGKRSLLLAYKDGLTLDQTKAEPLPELTTLTYKKQLENTHETAPLVFTLSRTPSNEMIPSMSTKRQYDLILILIDLSSEQAQRKLEYYSNYANTHFPKVKTLLIGTKQDQQLESNALDGLISTSVKTQQGFDQFEKELLHGLNLDNKKILAHGNN